MRNLVLIVISLFTLLFTFCEKVDTTQTITEYDYGYFPLDSGDWRLYWVTDITIDDPLDVYDTLNYYLLEKVGAVFIDAAGDTTRILNRYYREDITGSWQNYQTWYAGIKDDIVLQTEENIKYVKQRFPLYLGKTWNGNAYNRTDTLNEYEYEVTQIDLPETINNLSFDSVLVVTERDFTSLVEKNSHFDKYAFGIGLVERQQVDVVSTIVDADVDIEDRVSTGTMYYQKIVAYGKAQ